MVERKAASEGLAMPVPQEGPSDCQESGRSLLFASCRPTV
jgi:hypothetical protein